MKKQGRMKAVMQFVKPIPSIIYYSENLMLKICRFSLKNMNIRQKVCKVYSIVSFSKRSLNLSLFLYPTNV